MNKKTKKKFSYNKITKKGGNNPAPKEISLNSVTHITNPGGKEGIASMTPKRNRFKRTRAYGDYGSAVWGVFGVIALIYSFADVYRTEKGIKIGTWGSNNTW